MRAVVGNSHKLESGGNRPSNRRDFRVLQSDALATVFCIASLTPQELQEARLRSGNLGGRPRKPTTSESRAAALEELLPLSLRVLREELEAGGPQAVRAALQLFAHGYGKPRETVQVLSDTEGAIDLDSMSDEQLEARAAELRLAVASAEATESQAA